MKAIIGTLRSVLLGDLLPPDTQSGFKAMDADAARAVVRMAYREKGFSFDVQLLARVTRHTGNTPLSTPVVCLDSSEESTADNDSTYFEMFATFVRIASQVGRERHPVVSLLEDLAFDHGVLGRVVWNGLNRLMALNLVSPEARELAAQGINLQNLQLLHDRFTVQGNSTSSSITLDQQTLSALRGLIDQIKAIHINK